MATSGATITTQPDSSWMRRAACQDKPGDVLTPGEGEDEESKRLLANRDRLCNGDGLKPCPVLGECLAWALAAKVRTGIAGGLTAIDREPLAGRYRRRAT